MARPFVSAGLVAFVVAGVVALGAPPAAAGEGEPPKVDPPKECVEAFVSHPTISNKPSLVVCPPPDPDGPVQVTLLG